jgi:hypothetical protein
MLLYGPSRADTNKWAEFGQKTKHIGLARYGPFTSKPVKPVFFAINPTFRLA